MEDEMIVRWVKLESWHIVSGEGTRCGLDFNPEEAHGYSDDLPMHEKSCENCLRLVAHDKEQTS